MKHQKQNIIGLNFNEVITILENLGEKRFHAKQIWNWIYYFGTQSFDTMSNLSKELRQKLNENYTIERESIVKDLISKDGTRKWLIEFSDGEKVEIVYIPEEDRGTLCISSQIGCGMGCSFCNTGTQRITRNMTSGEIIQQFMIARDCLDEWKNISKPIGKGRKITNIVFMGMGEPLANYDNVVKSIKILMDDNGIAFSNRRITVSTCGIVPKIRQLAKDDIKINLAISLHATTDEIRNSLMPINQKYNIDKLMKACNYYAENTSYRRITFEYIMINGLNDGLEDAKRLVKLVKKYKIPAKFNLIPFNPWTGCNFKPSSSEKMQKFAKVLTDARYPCPIRKPRGQDIMAACGQLKSTINNLDFI
ncbi:23S rRNA (adenine(2503)-C(2))-methyltransferase RlmN [Pseudomonadota bacterium]